MLLHDDRFCVQGCDLMELNSPTYLGCPENVDVAIADAQDLGKRTNPERQRGAIRNPLRTASGVGVRAASALLGIWALTLQEFFLALSVLRSGGTFFFRFGWRGRGAREEPWYAEATHLLFGFVLAHFESVQHFKSEFSHQAGASFYAVATGFRREHYLELGTGDQLRGAVERVVNCSRPADLPQCLAAIAPELSAEERQRVDKLLDIIGRLRAIGMATRNHLEGGGRPPSPEAALWLSPVPLSLTLQRIRERLERFGKIAYVRRRAHAVGVGADAVVQFTQVAHATAALQAITEMQILGSSLTVRRLSELQGAAQGA